MSKRFTLHKDKSLKERMVSSVRRTRVTDDFWALQDVDVTIDAGTTVGLIGANGSGKSTLLKVMGAILQPTTGTVQRRGRLAALLELGAGFHPDLTGRENVYLNAAILGMTRAETARHIDAIIDFSGIEKFIDTQVKFYSSGMYVRLAFAVAIHVDPDLLLVDEVLAVGDEPFQRKCMDKIRSFQAEGRTIVLVSHSADQVGDLCDRAVLLQHGRVAFDGAPAQALRALRDGFEEARVEEEVEHHVPEATAHITSAVLLDAAGRATDRIRTGDAVTIRLHVEPRVPVVDWLAAVSIETTLGHSIFRFNSRTADVELGELREARTVDFTFPSLPLGEGQYVVNVGIGEPSGATLHRIPHAITLSVDGPHVGTGVLGVEPAVVTASA
ncbi:ABC transporter ATP-binding protein [Actinotalea sp. Marseille-Q4924]|uniref:ABC transporter ATP-binding protein n=1 Tax=Actinotalea sp. Marseille-Q4924 TaxID=2866571 RepID=UPI001CE42D54|nr:ABC transporter ATP-binding protein [Actinotalea sp. Marseille-Q4924]